MRHPFDEVRAPWWTKKTVWVVGGGYSIKSSGLDKDIIRSLPGVKVGCNKSAWLYDCDVLFTLDQHFARMHRKNIEKFIAQGGKAYLAAAPNDDNQTIEGATYLIRRRNPGLSRNPADIYGVNSGYGALGLAYLKRAKDIRLLGFDMRYGPKGQTHCHNGYPWHNHNNARLMKQWSRAFAQAAVQLEADGVRVTNYIGNPVSLIEDFPTQPAEVLCGT